jgi:hypothetical protein
MFSLDRALEEGIGLSKKVYEQIPVVATKDKPDAYR